METLFRRPRIYRAKRRIAFLMAEKNDLDIEQYVKDKTVFDLGCGPAISSVHTGKAREFVGIDISEVFIKEAVRRNPKDKFLVANAVSLPFRDKSFDVTVISGVLHHVSEDINTVMREIERVTKEKIILMEPLQSEKGIKRMIKSMWWGVTDGGSHYYTKEEWGRILGSFVPVAERCSGRLFHNSYTFVGEVRNKGNLP